MTQKPPQANSNYIELPAQGMLNHSQPDSEIFPSSALLTALPAADAAQSSAYLEMPHQPSKSHYIDVVSAGIFRPNIIVLLLINLQIVALITTLNQRRLS